ncbi:hypothetical protein Hamer_G019443 [Homarus americanus]|uniref:Uncharacterized protein n=1 Tax=Homarus americanus TaxID=6706 RepID=A0A8J5JIV5_HOMAM|nr:hypothetical protein Hamer_G019443 [Homarus americanus]
MRTLLPLWTVLLVVTYVGCVPVLENDDAGIGKFLIEGIANEDFSSDTDLIISNVDVPEISVHMQPPDEEFQVIAKEVSIDGIIESDQKKLQPKKPIESTLNYPQPSRYLQPPTREFQASPKKTVATEYPSDTTPLTAHEEPFSSSDILKVFANAFTSNVKSIDQSDNSEVTQSPLEAFQHKKKKSSYSQKKLLTKAAWKKKQPQKAKHFPKPSTSDEGEMRENLVKTRPAYRPSTRLLPPIHEFARPPTPDRTPMTHQSPPLNRQLVILNRQLTPPDHDYVMPPPLALQPPH